MDVGLDRNLVLKQCSNMTKQRMRTKSELMKLKLYAAKETSEDIDNGVPNEGCRV